MELMPSARMGQPEISEFVSTDGQSDVPPRESPRLGCDNMNYDFDESKRLEHDGLRLHATEDLPILKQRLYSSLMNRYKQIACKMFEYDFTGEKFQFLRDNTLGEIPEKWLFEQGRCCAFEYMGQVYFMPIARHATINVYGDLTEWKAVVEGNSIVAQKLRNLKLNPSNSVILQNNTFRTTDVSAIDVYVRMLVDNLVTLNQLQVHAKTPFVALIPEEYDLDGKLFYKGLAEGVGYMRVDTTLGEILKNSFIPTNYQIDPSLFELYDRIECQILETLGLDCVPITKRAQQSVAEVQSNQQKIFLMRQDKLEARQRACDRMNELFDCNISVKSTVDDIEAYEIEEEEPKQTEEVDE